MAEHGNSSVKLGRDTNSFIYEHSDNKNWFSTDLTANQSRVKEWVFPWSESFTHVLYVKDN